MGEIWAVLHCFFLGGQERQKSFVMLSNSTPVLHLMYSEIFQCNKMNCLCWWRTRTVCPTALDARSTDMQSDSYWIQSHYCCYYMNQHQSKTMIGIVFGIVWLRQDQYWSGTEHYGIAGHYWCSQCCWLLLDQLVDGWQREFLQHWTRWLGSCTSHSTASSHTCMWTLYMTLLHQWLPLLDKCWPI